MWWLRDRREVVLAALCLGCVWGGARAEAQGTVECAADSGTDFIFE